MRPLSAKITPETSGEAIKLKREIFIDSYVIVNALMNWACLYTAAKLTGVCARKRRLIIAALAGSFYALLNLAVEIPAAAYIFLWIPASALMCFISFGRQRPSRFVLIVAVTLSCGFACGGAAEGIVNLIGGIGGDGTDSRITLSVLILAVIFLVTAFRLSGELAKKKLNSAHATVRIDAFGKTKRMIALCDSGNLLTEPISGWPVVIIGAIEAKDFVPDDYFGGGELPVKNLFAVPITTLGGSKIIYGFMPQNLVISGGSKKNARKVSEVIVAVDSQIELFAGCGCLIPAKLI